jgi:type IV pilus assembly protein PilA
MRGEEGFSLVELLVVMMIIGLLAAIAIPSFFAQKEKARDASAEAAAKAAETAAETISTDNKGRYDGAGGVSVANLQQVEPSLGGAALSVPAVSQNGYTVRVASDTGNTFDITRNPGGTIVFTCLTPANAGCPADGTWAD